MNWDDLRYVLALANAGSLAKAGRALDVDHTTVGRRIEALESGLGIRLFTRTTTGYLLTPDAERILPELREVEGAVLKLQRRVVAGTDQLEGAVRVTSTETFSANYLAPRLAGFARKHPQLTIELVASHTISDLARREADIAVRFFRSKHDRLVLQRVAEVGYALYGTEEYLSRRPFPRSPADLADHEFVSTGLLDNDLEMEWLVQLVPNPKIAFASNLTLAMRAAALTGVGLTILPRYLGDSDPRLRRVPMPDEPSRTVWLTLHRDLQNTRRVRAVLDFLRTTLQEDRALLAGKTP